MADDEKTTAWPTLFQEKNGSWTELPNDEARVRAERENEIFTFPNQNELYKFARKGSWKKEEEYQEPNIQDDVVKTTVNKDGWADVNSYRAKKDDGQFIMNTQNSLIEKGFNVSNDGVWGNKTYSALNQDLVNKQLDNYVGDNFTYEQFQAQVYKESTGDNSKVSGRGARGIAQFLPSTFKWAKEKGWIPETAKISDKPAQALAQRRYMDHLFNDITVVKSAPNKEERQARAFASYNHGPDNFASFWGRLTDIEKKGGWRVWHKKANAETQKYVLWNMDRTSYKEDFSTPYKHKKGYWTSKWNDVNYGFDPFVREDEQYRYK